MDKHSLANDLQRWLGEPFIDYVAVEAIESQF